VKFDSVLFGEPIPTEALEASMAAANQADCVLIIGTSATVRPAGGLPRIAGANGAKLIEVNTSETGLSKSCDIVLRGKAAEVLPPLADAVATLVDAAGEAFADTPG
jgi:NAD-dependent deacetylase